MLPKLDVVSGGGSGLESYRLADDKCDGLGFSLPNLLCGQSAAVATMQHLMRDLVREGGEFLGGLHPGKQRNCPAVG